MAPWLSFVLALAVVIACAYLLFAILYPERF